MAHDIRTKAQLQQDKGTVVMTRPITKLKMTLCSHVLDAQTKPYLVPPLGASGTSNQTRSPVTNDAIKTFAQETISPKRKNIFLIKA